MRRIGTLLLAVFLVSTAALFAHRALAEAAPLAIAAWRLGLAAVFFLGWSALRHSAQSDRPALLSRAGAARLVLAGICLALHFVLWFASLQFTSVARATLLVCTTPLWTTLGSVILRRNIVRPDYWIALALAAIGIWLVTRTAAGPATPLALRGDLLAIGGGICFAVYLLSVEGLHATISSRMQVTVAYTVAAALLWLAVLFSHKGLTMHYSAGVWSALVGMTIGPQILGHTLLNGLLRHFPSSTIAFSLLLEPVIAAGLAWALLHQTVTIVQIVGGALVIAGLAVVIRRGPTPSAVAESAS